MPFLSIEFAVFWLCFLPLYWCIGQSPRYQNALLLITSLVLLARVHELFAVSVLVFAILIYFIANIMAQCETVKYRKFWLFVGIIFALINLVFFKYFDFFRPYMRLIWQNEIMDILMPLGISYYTFQAIAYLVTVYRQADVQLGFFDLLLHFSFFPTITAGPIIRVEEQKSVDGMQVGIAGQLQTHRRRYILRPALAIALILLGIVKKWWLVGELAEHWVNPVFENPLQYDAPTVLVAIYGYTFQLFLDFSGYTDLVMGLAMFLGFQLPNNFSMPLLAHNIRAFWERWHMTLSGWIRDYIYIPLGGNRLGFWRTQVNVMVAMVLSGVWHGYGWNFLVWGILHGMALMLLNLMDKVCGRDALASVGLGRMLGVLLTVTFVSMSFVVFRTGSLADAGLIFESLFGGGRGWLMPDLSTSLLLLGFLVFLCVYRPMVACFHWSVSVLERLPLWLWPFPIAMVLLFLLIVAPSGIPGFIYANF